MSDLAKYITKDPYVFDFLTLADEHNEKDLEDALTDHITKFLLELGAGSYKLTESIPENLKGKLLSIEELEKELQVLTSQDVADNS